jgi:hypothetical protein
MKLDELELNLVATDEGAWVEPIPNLEGVAFRVRGSEYGPYQKALRRAMTHQGRKQRIQAALDVDTEQYEAISRSLAADHLLLGWRGIEDSDGNLLEFSPELAKRLMTERKYRPFQSGVLHAINMVDLNLLEHREEAEGN